jgi:3-methyladenine DNA glycosylase Tag
MSAQKRCEWCLGDPLYIDYHDHEWGVPVHDDRKLFEFLILAYSWQFVDGKRVVNRWRRLDQLPATSRESDAFSKDLKQRGFKFVGSTIIYAHMQAVGMVNDHLVSCFRYKRV